MPDRVVLLSIPGLRPQDLPRMPNLRGQMAAGDEAALAPSFPCVTCPVQANMTTGVTPDRHGVVANGFYWRERGQVEMWTAWNDCILAPQIWDRLHAVDAGLTSAVWFPLHSKGCGADYICTPAPIHNPDGSESLWCYTRPTELYGELRDELGHFPLQHFWGPLANLKSTDWIIDSALAAARRWQPHFFYVYLPHLDYAAQKTRPDSPAAAQAVVDLDASLGRLFQGFAAAYGSPAPLWLAASEYAVAPVSAAAFPNRVLRRAGLLEVVRRDDGEHLDLAGSAAWTLVDHQHGHVFVRDRDPATIARAVDLFRHQPGIAEVLTGDDLERYDLRHERTGDLVLVSAADRWQAYYWWDDDALAPAFARTVDIHRKPGYDPVELHFDPVRKQIPLDASLVRGSHGAPARDPAQRGVLLSSERGVLPGAKLADTDVCDLVLRQFGA